MHGYEHADGASPPWWRPNQDATPGGAAYGELIDAVRGFLGALAAAHLDPEDSIALRDLVSELTGRLREQEVPEDRQIFARRPDLPGRGQVLAPVFEMTRQDDDRMEATTWFGRFFLGGGGAVHGGAIPLLFDDAIGLLVNNGGRPSRTAFLNVDYLALTPIETELDLVVWRERTDGRKSFVTGELRHGGTVCARAHALFVALRPHRQQPIQNQPSD